MGFWHMCIWNHIHLCFTHRIHDRHWKIFNSLPRKMAHSSWNTITKTPPVLQKVWHRNECKPALNMLHTQVLSKGFDKLKAAPWSTQLHHWKAGFNLMAGGTELESILNISVTITNTLVWELSALQNGALVWYTQLWYTTKHAILMIQWFSNI